MGLPRDVIKKEGEPQQMVTDGKMLTDMELQGDETGNVHFSLKFLAVEFFLLSSCCSVFFLAHL